MNRRSKTARLLTGGLIGVPPGYGDEHWDDVSLLIRGDALTDLSANGHTVNEYGSTTPLYNDTTRKKYASGSLKFDGADDYLSISDDNSLEFGSDDFTVEAWVYHDGNMTGYVFFAGKTNFDANKSPFIFGTINASGGSAPMRFLVGTSSTYYTAQDPSNFPIDQWVHVAGTRSGNTITLWINGQAKATATLPNGAVVVDNIHPLYIGKYVASMPTGAVHWKGNIEDFRITKGVARYTDTTNGFTPPTASLPTSAPVVGRRGVGTYDGISPPITNALEFDGANDYLTRSQTTPTEPKKWTWSGWVKNQGTGEQVLLGAKTVATGQALVEFVNGRFGVRRWTGSFNDLNTFTDTPFTNQSEWNHFVLAYDSTAQSVEIWVNGQLESLVNGGGGTAEYPSLNQTISLSDGSEDHYVGARGQLSYWFDGQLAEVHFVDGQALTASDFGADVNGTWSAKDYTGTYGTNGFYLDFKDSASLGTDNSGNGNNFTGASSLATNNQVAVTTSDIPQVFREAGTLRTRGYLGAAPAGGMLTLYDRLLDRTASGGLTTDITVGGQDYRVHTFNSSGTFTVHAPLTDVEYLVIGGGGGGGAGSGGPGGGGAGGYLEGTLPSLSVGNQTITVGAGGAGATAIGMRGSDGSNSSLGSFATATGGGGGGGRNQATGGAGGSGGGGADYNSSTGATSAAGGFGASGQGNNGGSGSYNGSSFGGGGGGGAGGAGANGSTVGGVGGVGKASSITGTSVTRAGGGGGTGPGSSRSGGSGGGGASATINTDNPGSDGTANTGSGGGGGTLHQDSSGNYAATKGGDGGSGVVIIRYKI